MITLTGGGKVVVLRSASFGDGYRVHLGLQLKRSMDGTPYCTIKTPVRKLHFFTVTNFNTPKRLEVQDFIRATAGKDVMIRFTYPEVDELIINARLVGQPFETTHQGVRNTTVDLEYEELPN